MGRRIVIVPRRGFKVPVEAEKLRPDLLENMTIHEIEKIYIYEGNRKCKLSDLFIIREESIELEEQIIVLKGNLSKVWRLGENMTSGTLIVEGNCGNLLGYKMKGGKIVVKGNARSWVGAEMSGGTIEIYGNVGDHLGSVLRGLKRNIGMRGGTIIVHGNAGAEVGVQLQKGLIVIHGNTDVLPGLRMNGGTILIRGDCGGKAGARMTGGKIVICGNAGGILPTFYLDSIVKSVKVKKEKIEGPFYLLVGDVVESPECRGRLYVSVNHNPELKPYEELLEIPEEL